MGEWGEAAEQERAGTRSGPAAAATAAAASAAAALAASSDENAASRLNYPSVGKKIP